MYMQLLSTSGAIYFIHNPRLRCPMVSKTCYVNYKNSSVLKTCKIWGFLGDEEVDSVLMGCNVMWMCRQRPMFQRKIQPASSRLECIMFIWYVGIYVHVVTALQARRPLYINLFLKWSDICPFSQTHAFPLVLLLWSRVTLNADWFSEYVCVWMIGIVFLVKEPCSDSLWLWPEWWWCGRTHYWLVQWEDWRP